ncbi:hypothetical protein TNCV_4658311 [Trichonephila clavipes]|nr:hypothetical protein TNCV_4658311 [Trichonephila clavipes]
MSVRDLCAHPINPNGSNNLVAVWEYHRKKDLRKAHIEDWFEEDDYEITKILELWVCCPEEDVNHLRLKLSKLSLLLMLKEPLIPSILQQVIDLGKSVVVFDETKQMQCGYVTVGCRRVRQTYVVDRIQLSAIFHGLRVPFDTVCSTVVCPQDVHYLVYPRRRTTDFSAANGRRMWALEWNEVVFTGESCISLQHHDGQIRDWRHR